MKPKTTKYDKNQSQLIKEAEGLYANYLKKEKNFFTNERKVILNSIFEYGEGHFSTDELLFELQKSSKKVSRATLYRALKQLVGAGVLVEADFGHGHTHYEISVGHKHHIHLICSDSGTVKEVESPELEKVLQKIAKSENFNLKSHKIQLFGVLQK